MEYKRIEKNENGRTVGGAFRTNVLRLLGINNDSEDRSCASQKSAQICVPADNIIGCQGIDNGVILEAERMKADAVMEWQRRRFTY